MSNRPRIWSPGDALNRDCPTCSAKIREPCVTPTGKPYGGFKRNVSGERVPWHAARCSIEQPLTRYAVTSAGAGHVRDADAGSSALCGTKVTFTEVDRVYLRCKECRGIEAYVAAHPDSPHAKRLLPA